MNANSYRAKVLYAIPSNWCDELLTGKGTQIPLDCPAVERLLNGIKKRLEAIPLDATNRIVVLPASLYDEAKAAGLLGNADYEYVRQEKIPMRDERESRNDSIAERVRQEIDARRSIVTSQFASPAHDQIHDLFDAALQATRPEIERVTGPDEHGSVYIYFQPERCGEKDIAKVTLQHSKGPGIAITNMDYDENGHLYGIEILAVARVRGQL